MADLTLYSGRFNSKMAVVEHDVIDTNRYASWAKEDNHAMLRGDLSLDDIAPRVNANDINPSPASGKQEYLENVINRFV